MSFNADPIKNHLSNYKLNELNVSKDGIWINNWKQYSHILPYNERSKNLIEKEYFQDLLKCSLNSGKSLHPGFHHLNSSQAMAVNLLVPLISENMISYLLNHFKLNDEIQNCEFEFIEDELEGTNFDFFIQGKRNKYFFEVKYTEQGFGYANDDKRHKEKYENIYLPRLETINPIKWDEFRKKYQLWRNISYSNEGHVFFVFPDFRNDLSEIIQEARQKIATKDKVHILSVESILQIFEGALNKKVAHISEFRRKYLEIDTRGT